MRLARFRRFFRARSVRARTGAPGEVSPVVDATPLAAELPRDTGPARPAPPPLWPPERLILADALWGEGFVAPGGPEEVRRLVRPLGLTEADSLLLLGAGAGGPTLAANAVSGAWVSGFEVDPALVAAAGARAARCGKGIAERATVARWSPTDPIFRRQGFHHALALDVIGNVTAPAILSALASALKPHGQLMMVQTVAAPDFDPAGVLEQRWLELARLGTPPPDEASVTARLRGLGFELWVTEDVSAHQASLAVGGWKLVVSALDGQGRSTRRAAVVVAEAELWLCRLRLMQSGRLRSVRWHGRSAGT